MSASARPFETAELLRQAFDRTFTEAPRAASDPVEHFLAIRVGDAAYAVRLAEVAALVVDRKVVALPSPAPDFLGLVGLRGNIIPVYDLGAFLGHSAEAAGRWLLLAGETRRFGLAFAELERHIQALPADLTPKGAVRFGGEHVREALRVGEALRPIISLASISEAVKRRSAPPDRR